MQNLKKSVLIAMLQGCVIALAPATTAIAQNASAGSANSASQLSSSTAEIVHGASFVLMWSAVLSIVHAEKIGESIAIVVKDASTGALTTIKTSARVAEQVSLAAGTAVSVVAGAAGHSLYIAGTLVAYIPAEVGASLLHHSPVSEPK